MQFLRIIPATKDKKTTCPSAARHGDSGHLANICFGSRAPEGAVCRGRMMNSPGNANTNDILERYFPVIPAVAASPKARA